jgi:hypothetical protein
VPECQPHPRIRRPEASTEAIAPPPTGPILTLPHLLTPMTSSKNSLFNKFLALAQEFGTARGLQARSGLASSALIFR